MHPGGGGVACVTRLFLKAKHHIAKSQVGNGNLAATANMAGCPLKRDDHTHVANGQQDDRRETSREAFPVKKSAPLPRFTWTEGTARKPHALWDVS